MTDLPKPVSLYHKVFGPRSFLSIIFGQFFETKNNTASLLSVMLVGTVCYVIIFQQKFEYLQLVLNVIFVIIGYYFGAKQGPVSEDEEKGR